MLRWAIGFFVISLVAALFGFGGIAESAAGIAKVLFYGFISLTGITLAAGLLVGKKAIT